MSDAKVVPISEAPARIAALVEEIQTNEPCFIATKEGIRAVLLSIEAFDTLIEGVENLEDSLSILEARIANEPARPLDEFLHERRLVRVADVSG